jgi:hypothetical protein
MSRTRRSLLGAWGIIPGAFAACLFVGCGGAADNLPRQPVSGTVKFKGQPLKTGLIEFQPAGPGMATAGAAAITDGSYSIARAEGLQPGKYEVRITSAPQTVQRPPGVLPGDYQIPPAKELIPEKFNSNTTLSAEVTKDGPNKLDFDLQEK